MARTAVQKDPKMYAPAPEVKNLLRDIVFEHYPNLAGVEIQAIFGTDPQKKDGKAILASTSVIRGRPAWLSGGLDRAEDQDEPSPYFLIEVFKGAWDQLTPQQKRALIDHQLQFCGVSPKGVLKLRHYDIQEFGPIIHRHGFWRSGIQDIYDLAKKHDPQLKLHIEEGGKAEESAPTETRPPRRASNPKRQGVPAAAN